MNNPKRPYEKERIDNELLLLGTYGLKNKREIDTNLLSLSIYSERFDSSVQKGCFRDPRKSFKKRGQGEDFV